MKIIVLHIGNILKYPPIMNLLNIINDLQIECLVITTKSEFNDNEKFKTIRFCEIKIEYEKINSPIKKLLYLKFIRNNIWKIIKAEYNEDDVIWVSSNVALKYLGNNIVKMNYVLHLMELFKELRYFNEIPFLKFNSHKIADNALAVVVPEYNRAHITKAWWNLKSLPLIFHNKPCYYKNFNRNMDIRNKNAKTIIDKIKNKKILLYQGIVDDKERPLVNYIKAIEKMGNDYAFVIMSSGENIYKHIKSKNYYFIPYIKPPLHLEVTSHAYIGILSYYPVKSFSSELNSIYCAPNKTFEYSMFAIPMIGNDVPGLKYVFEPYNAGVCLEEFTVENICKAIKHIESNYEAMSCGAHKYYDSVDLKKEFINILDTVNRRKAERI